MKEDCLISTNAFVTLVISGTATGLIRSFNTSSLSLEVLPPGSFHQDAGGSNSTNPVFENS
jgi:hypothetical protein